MTFTMHGFNNWKKALQSFSNHEHCSAHQEAVMKWQLAKKTESSIGVQLSAAHQKLQASRRQALLKQLYALRFLLHQGIAIRGHTEAEGNLQQLLNAWTFDDSNMKSWLEANKYLSHIIVNEQITMMSLSVFRSLLACIKKCSPSWYSIIGDEATNVVNREQLNLSIRWVNDDNEVDEDPVGLFSVPDTTSNTLTKVIQDMLKRCSLPLSLCRSQAYDGAANMHGKRNGVATKMHKEVPAAIAVHCFVHSLNLCLQDAGKKLVFLHNALDAVKEIAKLIKFSPKWSHLFSDKLAQPENSGVTITPLCPTHWTARTGTVEAVLKDYSILMETMKEINHTTHDEYGLKAGGILSLLEKFDMLFGLTWISCFWSI